MSHIEFEVFDDKSESVLKSPENLVGKIKLSGGIVPESGRNFGNYQPRFCVLVEAKGSKSTKG